MKLQYNLVIRCGWCNRDMGIKSGEGETTSICETCSKLLMASLRLAEIQLGDAK